MRENYALRVCGLGLIVLVAAPGQVFGATSFATGRVHTASVSDDGHWNEFIPGSGNSLSLESSHGTMLAKAQAGQGGFGTSATWHLLAEVSATATDQHRGAFATGEVLLTITDEVTPTVDCSFGCPFYEDGDDVYYIPRFFISGTTTGNVVGPGGFRVEVDFRASLHTTVVADGHEYFSSDSGYEATLPRGQTPGLGVDLEPDVPVALRVDMRTYADVYNFEDSGSARAKADFSHTFRWGEVTDVFTATTGERIPAEFFHLYGEDGFDWAHPPAVPEPSAIGLLAPLALFLTRHRRFSRGDE
jgi:hypothetical protein